MRSKLLSVLAVGFACGVGGAAIGIYANESPARFAGLMLIGLICYATGCLSQGGKS